VSFIPVNLKDQDSMQEFMMHLDAAVHFGENREPLEPKDEFIDGNDSDFGADNE
jgi:hypothetical protein